MLYVEVDGAHDGEPLLEVPLITATATCKETGREVKAKVFQVKPFYERYIKLFQGEEFDEFEVDASHMVGEGLLLMAISRTCASCRG